MAMISLDTADRLRDAGLTVVEHDGWKKKGSKGVMGVPAAGLIIHHTAAGGTKDHPSLAIFEKGRPDLPPPVVQFSVTRSGIVHIFAAGQCNHAGKGSSVTLADVKAGREVIKTAKERGLKDDIGGNKHYAGIEVENAGTGKEPYGDACVDAFTTIAAVVAIANGRGPQSSIAHKQHTARKIDISLDRSIWYPKIVATYNRLKSGGNHAKATSADHGLPPIPAGEFRQLSEAEWQSMTGDGVLTVGDTGDAVIMLQRLLVKQGHPVVIDGVYGQGCVNVIAEIQRGWGAKPGPSLGAVGVHSARRLSLLK